MRTRIRTPRNSALSRRLALTVVLVLSIVPVAAPAPALGATVDVPPGSGLQAALAAASPGDTLRLAAGEYTTSGQVVISKPVTVVGAGRDATVIRPTTNTVGYPSIANRGAGSWLLVRPGASLGLQALTLDAGHSDGRITGLAIYAHGPVLADDIRITDVFYASNYGLGMALLGSGHEITNSRFDGCERIGIFVGAGSADASPTIDPAIQYSALISGCVFEGEGVHDGVQYGVESGRGGRARVDDCVFSGFAAATPDWGSAAVLSTSLYGPGAARMTLTGSTITSCSVGVNVGYATELWGAQTTDTVAVIDRNVFDDVEWDLVVEGAVGVVSTPTGTHNLAPDGDRMYFRIDGVGAVMDPPPPLQADFWNRVPVAVSDTRTVAQGETLTESASGVLTNDTDADADSLTAILATAPVHGTLAYLSPGGAFSYTPALGWVGEDTFTYRVTDGLQESAPATVTITTTVAPLTFVPIQGLDRIKTAIEVSKRAYPAAGSANVVLVATALNWPDALGGSALAGTAGGPILLTPPGGLTTEVVQEIQRLGPDRAYILGGTAAVGGTVANQLAGLVGGSARVTRFPGVNRYETSRMIAAEVKRLLGVAYDGSAFVATGANFPDALGASPIAAAKQRPLYLVPPTGPDAALIAEMRAVGVEEIVVLGGPNAVSATAENALRAGIPCTSARKQGRDRYETARAVAAYGVSQGLTWNRLALTTGSNFPDALAGGVLQGKSGSVILLTPGSALDPGVRDILVANKASIRELRYLGGPSAVSAAVRSAAESALR